MTTTFTVDMIRNPDVVATPAPRMALRGKIWLDEAGVPLAKPLRGWNWGHWGRVLPEWPGLHIQEGATVVRIVIRTGGLYPDGVEAWDDAAPGFISQAQLLLLDTYIAACVSRGLKVIITRDSNCGQNGSQDQDTYDYCSRFGVPGSNFWNNIPFRQKFWAGWALLAARYRHVPNVVVLEVLAEPAPPGVSSSQIHDFYAEGIATIRAKDPATILMIGGPNAYKLVKAKTVYDPLFRNVAYTGNILGPQAANTDTLADNFRELTDLRDEEDVGIFVQQLGCESSRDPSNIYLPGAIDLVQENDVGYTIWEYASPTSDSYGPKPTPGSDWPVKTDVYNAIVSRF